MIRRRRQAVRVVLGLLTLAMAFFLEGKEAPAACGDYVVFGGTISGHDWMSSSHLSHSQLLQAQLSQLGGTSIDGETRHKLLSQLPAHEDTPMPAGRPCRGPGCRGHVPLSSPAAPVVIVPLNQWAFLSASASVSRNESFRFSAPNDLSPRDGYRPSIDRPPRVATISVS